VIEITRRYGESRITQRITMQAGTPRRIDFVTDVDWQARQTLLRALFPLDINANRATCEIQFGAVERPTHRNTSWDVARFEVCAHRWVDLSEGDYGVALLNDAKYGHSLHDNTLGLSLLRGTTHPDPDADRGQHHFTYSLFPHRGDWRKGRVVKEAYALNVPLLGQRRDGPQPGALPARWSFLETDAYNAVVETIKAADDGDGLIVRLYEAHNMRRPVRLRFALPVKSAAVVDLFEQEIGAVEIEGNEVMFPIRPFEIKTLRVKF
jgi:alpha-mannosidase